MRGKEGNTWKDFRHTNEPTVGPGIKSTGEAHECAYCMLKVKHFVYSCSLLIQRSQLLCQR